MPFTKLGLKPHLFMRLCPRVLSSWWTAGDGGLPACPSAAPPQGLVPHLHKGAASVGSAQIKLGQSRGAGQGRELCLVGRSGHSLTLICDPKSRLVTLVVIHRQGRIELPDTCVPSWGGVKPSCFSSYSKQASSSQYIKCFFFYSFAFLCLLLLTLLYKWPKSIVLKCSAEALSTLKCALWRE